LSVLIIYSVPQIDKKGNIWYTVNSRQQLFGMMPSDFPLFFCFTLRVIKAVVASTESKRMLWLHKRSFCYLLLSFFNGIADLLHIKIYRKIKLLLTVSH